LSTLKNVVTEFVNGFLKGCTTSIDKLVISMSLTFFSWKEPSTSLDTCINYSDIIDPVLKATIASFFQSCQTESNSIESEHVMESIIDSIRGTKWHGFQNEPMVLPPDHIIVISCLDLDPRGLNVVFKILMFISAGPDWRHSLNYLTMQRSMSVYMSNLSYRTLVHLLPVPFDNVHRLVAIHAHGPCMLPVLLLASLSIHRSRVRPLLTEQLCGYLVLYQTGIGTWIRWHNFRIIS
jgi:hypothetical protein